MSELRFQILGALLGCRPEVNLVFHDHDRTGQDDRDADEWGRPFDHLQKVGRESVSKKVSGFLVLTTQARPFEPVDAAASILGALANLHQLIEEKGAVVTHETLPSIF